VQWFHSKAPIGGVPKAWANSGDIAAKCSEFVGRNRSVVGYRSNELGTVGDGGFADAPVDLTITSKAKIKNSNAAIHHIISYQRILSCAVVFAG